MAIASSRPPDGAKRAFIRRTVLTFFGATLVTSLLTALLVALWAPKALVNEQREQLHEQARALSAALGDRSFEEVENVLRKMSEDSAITWELVASDGGSPPSLPRAKVSETEEALAVEVPLFLDTSSARLRASRTPSSSLFETRSIIVGGAVVAAGLAFCLFLFSADRLISPLFLELQRLEDVRRDFVANVSHELKTPLTASRGIVETMIDDPEMDADTRRLFLFKIRDQTRRLSALVSDLLALSRIEADPRNLHVTEVDLRGVVEEAIASFWGNIEGKSLEIVRTLPDQPVVLDGDRESMAVAIGNLLDNAIKYSPDKARIDVTLELVDGAARFSVKDQGIGIPEGHLSRIFERFYRVDAARSKALGGTGLGLSIVKHIALAHRGNVAVESTLGEGSIFSLTLPLDPRPDRREG